MPAHDQKAHAAVWKAITAGELVKPDVCEACGLPPAGKGKIHAHHADYSKPLEVEWLCPKCHRGRPSGVNSERTRTPVMLRLPPDLHAEMERVAAEQSVSLNTLLAALLSGAVDFSLAA